MTQKQRWMVTGIAGLLLLMGMGGCILWQRTTQPEKGRITETGKAPEKGELAVSGGGISTEDGKSGIEPMPDHTPQMADGKAGKPEEQVHGKETQADKADGKQEKKEKPGSEGKSNKKGKELAKKQPQKKKEGGGLTVADPEEKEPSVDLGHGDKPSGTEGKEKPTAKPTTKLPTEGDSSQTDNKSEQQATPAPTEELWGPVL